MKSVWRARFKWNYKRTSWAKIQSEHIINVKHSKRNKSKHDVIAYNGLQLDDGLELFYRRGAFYVNCFSVEAIKWKITKDDRHKAITRSSNGLICQKISLNLCAHFQQSVKPFRHADQSSCWSKCKPKQFELKWKMMLNYCLGNRVSVHQK